jgi:mRNA interferase RelE/StbE
MQLKIERKFLKDVEALSEKGIKKQIAIVVERLKDAENLKEIVQIKPMQGAVGYYRIRIGDYRMGLKMEDGVVILLRIKHRKEIYRVFP